jgi:hypothetical protein
VKKHENIKNEEDNRFSAEISTTVPGHQKPDSVALGDNE